MLALIIAVLVIGIDRAAKIYAVTCVRPQGTVEFIPGLIRFTYVENRGAAHGIFNGARWPLIVFTALALALAIWFVIRNYRRMTPLFRISAGMIIGGGLGNLFDRVVYGYVVDMLEAEFIDYAVCNPADNLLVIGAVLLGIYVLFFDKEFFREKKKEVPEANDEESSDREDPPDAE